MDFRDARCRFRHEKSKFSNENFLVCYCYAFSFFFLFLNLRIYPNQIIDFDDVWQNSFEENSEMDFHRILVKFDKNLQTFPFSRMFSLWKGKEERALLWNKARWI